MYSLGTGEREEEGDRREGGGRGRREGGGRSRREGGGRDRREGGAGEREEGGAREREGSPKILVHQKMVLMVHICYNMTSWHVKKGDIRPKGVGKIQDQTLSKT